jgi:hypothetical protein
MKEVQEFCGKYDAVVGPSSRMHLRSRRVAVSDWIQDFHDIRTMPYEKVPCVEIHMPEDRFRALMEHDHWLEREFRRNEEIIGNGAVRLVREYERECRIRNEHPGVQAAWEQYQIMLRLVDSGSEF